MRSSPENIRSDRGGPESLPDENGSLTREQQEGARLNPETAMR